MGLQVEREFPLPPDELAWGFQLGEALNGVLYCPKKMGGFLFPLGHQCLVGIVSDSSGLEICWKLQLIARLRHIGESAELHHEPSSRRGSLLDRVGDINRIHDLPIPCKGDAMRQGRIMDDVAPDRLFSSSKVCDRAAGLFDHDLRRETKMPPRRA